MGGYGSGRTGGKRKVEHSLSLCINHLNRKGVLKPGWAGDWYWSREGRKVSEITMRTSANQITLSFYIQCEGEQHPITQPIKLLQVPCNYGGTRPFFRCPGVVNGNRCSRRVGKLFQSGRYFLCRHCHRMAYASQFQERIDRMLRRANKRRIALGGEPGAAQWIARKPKGMWERTYQKHRAEIEWCEFQANLEFLARYQQVLSAEEREVYFCG